MMDLDSYLQSEIDDLNDMFQEFETQDEKHKKRSKDEEEKIMTKVSKKYSIPPSLPPSLSLSPFPLPLSLRAKLFLHFPHNAQSPMQYPCILPHNILIST